MATWAAFLEAAEVEVQDNRNFIRSQGGPAAALLAALDALHHALTSAPVPRVGQLRALAAVFGSPSSPLCAAFLSAAERSATQPEAAAWLDLLTAG